MPAPTNHLPYLGCETGGRPLKYTQEFIEAEAEALEKWMKQPGSIYFKRFAFDRGYSQQRLSEFAESNQKFSETLVIAREWQEIRLAEGGLKGEFNAHFCKFVMNNACGWSDKPEVKVSEESSLMALLIKEASGKSGDLVNEK
jgi:hypothetical protein